MPLGSTHAPLPSGWIWQSVPLGQSTSGHGSGTQVPDHGLHASPCGQNTSMHSSASHCIVSGLQTWPTGHGPSHGSPTPTHSPPVQYSSVWQVTPSHRSSTHSAASWPSIVTHSWPSGQPKSKQS